MLAINIEANIGVIRLQLDLDLFFDLFIHRDCAILVVQDLLHCLVDSVNGIEQVVSAFSAA